ncbi:MAG TPA: YIP1 family protein [Thermomicrobiales bacterium]|nr:YIP1 family protein [Thermomicrobiales bacterium]
MQPATRSGSGTGSRSLIDRMIGVARLDPQTYRDIEHDTDATPQALVVVVLAVIAAAIGAIGGEGGQAGIVAQALMAVINWIVFSLVAFYVGSALFATAQTEVTLGQVLRLVGFAQAPKLLGALAFIPLLGWIAGLAASIWFIIAAVFALREAFDFQTDRAIGTAVVSGLVMFVVAFAVALVLGVTGSILGWLF